MVIVVDKLQSALPRRTPICMAHAKTSLYFHNFETNWRVGLRTKFYHRNIQPLVTRKVMGYYISGGVPEDI